MSKSLFIFDFYETLAHDPYIQEQEHYRINSLWSVVEKSGFPISYRQTINAYQEVVKEMKEMQQQYISLSLFELVYRFAQKIKVAEEVHIRKFYDIWAYTSLQYRPEFFPHVKEALTLLKNEGKKIALISNTALTPGITLRYILQDFGIYELFDDLVFSDEISFMKPQSCVFNRVLEFFDIKASQACFIGDHPLYDKQGANNVGIEYLLMNREHDLLDVIQKYLAKN